MTALGCHRHPGSPSRLRLVCVGHTSAIFSFQSVRPKFHTALIGHRSSHRRLLRCVGVPLRTTIWRIWAFCYCATIRGSRVIPFLVGGQRRPRQLGIAADTRHLFGSSSLRPTIRQQTGLLCEWMHIGSAAHLSTCLASLSRSSFRPLVKTTEQRVLGSIAMPTN